jgi:hypothetical protein
MATSRGRADASCVGARSHGNGLDTRDPGADPDAVGEALAARDGALSGATAERDKRSPPNPANVGLMAPTAPQEGLADRGYPGLRVAPDGDLPRQADASLRSDQVNETAPPPNSGHTDPG